MPDNKDSELSEVRPKKVAGQQAKLLAPNPVGTIVFVLCCFLADTLSQAESASGLARLYAFWIGLGISVSLFFDGINGWRNLVRADTVCLSALYVLTLFEFLFPQEGFDDFGTAESFRSSLSLITLSFALFAIFRHSFSSRQPPTSWLRFREIDSCLLYTSPSPRDLSTSRMPSSA